MKRVLSLVLAVVMVLGLTTVAFAADEKTARQNYKNYIFGTINTAGTTVTEGNLPVWETHAPGAELKVYIGFSNGLIASTTPGVPTTASPIKKTDSHKLGVNLNKKAGAAGIDSASIEFDSNKNAYVELTLSDPFVSTKSIEWEALLTITYDGKRVKDAAFTLDGELENPSEEVNKDDEEFYAEDAPVLDVKETNNKLEVILNDDVSLISKVFAGKKYFASINDEPDDAAVAIMDKYRDIVNFAELKTVGLSSSTVKFNYSDNMYAYTTDTDGNLVYVGRTNESLPYYNRFFISAKELEIAVEEPDVAPEDGDTETPETGGDTIAPTPDNNYNPGTGR